MPLARILCIRKLSQFSYLVWYPVLTNKSLFPPLDTHTDPQRNVVSKPFIPSPITSAGHLKVFLISTLTTRQITVEKHSEIVRGKKRLVIDYQPLNMFLQDDKFPLPRRKSMFTFLKNGQIFSKFDLKSGFWQLGIEPSERYKTAFCIPNAHFQWTVLPFGLKTAPSIFQK